MKIVHRGAGAMAAALALLAALLAAPAANADPEPVEHLIGGFESDDEGWMLGLGPEFPGAQGTFGRDDTDAVEGGNSGLLTGEFSEGGNYVRIARDLDVDVQELRLWVRSDDVSQITLRMVDSTGQTHQQRLALEPGGQWQELVVTELAGGLNYAHFGGANDGVWHGPATQMVLMLSRVLLLPDRTGGEIHVDQVTVVAPPPPLPDLEIVQATPGNIFVQPETVTLGVRTRGDEVAWSLTDFWGEQVAAGVEAGGELSLDGLVDELGYYRLELTASLDGEPIARRETMLALLSPFDVAEVEDSPFGTVPHSTREDDFDKLTLAAKMGAKNIREAAGWSSIESAPGVYGYNRYDPLAAELDELGMRWLPVASYTNANYDGNATPYTDAGRAGFANYTADVVDHFDGEVEWIEIFNEFNVGFGRRGGSPANSRADYYFPLLKAAYERIKATDPDVTVVGGATSSVPLDWLEELFALGGLEYMDVLSIHPYLYPADPEALTELLDGVKDLVREYNGGELIPIWISEQGYPTNRHAEGVSEATQAKYLVRSQVTGLAAGVEKFFWYNLMNEGLNPVNREHEYGIIRHYDDPRGRYVPKPAYVSYAAMTRQLSDADYDRSDDAGAGVQSHVFRSEDGTETRVLWSAEPTTVTVQAGEPVTVTDLMGASRTYHPQAGQVHLSVTEAPIYLSGPHVRDVTASPKMELTGGDVAMGEPVELTLSIDNTIRPQARISGTFEIAGHSVPVSVAPGQHASIPITLPPESVTGERTYTGDLVVRGASMARLSARVDVTEPVELSGQHVLRDGTDTLAVTVGNLTAAQLDLDSVDWSVGDQSGTLPLPEPLAPGERWTGDVPLSGLAPGSHDRELRATVSGHPDVVSTGEVEIVPAAELTPVAERTVTVDGVLDDLTGVPGFELTADGVRGRWVDGVDHWAYNGPDDLSGTVWPTWDEDNLYLSARVTDDTFHQRNPGPTAWIGDSIQFTVSAGTAGEERPLRYYNITLGGTPDAPQVYRYLSAAEPVGPVTDVELVMTRDEAANETVYELALPWSELTPVSADDRLLGFSAQVNDNDGLDRKGWIQTGTVSARLVDVA